MLKFGPQKLGFWVKLETLGVMAFSTWKLNNLSCSTAIYHQHPELSLMSNNIKALAAGLKMRITDTGFSFLSLTPVKDQSMPEASLVDLGASSNTI